MDVGRAATATLRLTTRARRRLAGSRTLRATALAGVGDAAGNVKVTTTRITLMRR